jgi:hypothetical protein
MSQRIHDEAGLLSNIRFALRGLDPCRRGARFRPRKYARKVVEHLKLCGWEIHRPVPKAMHRTR